MIDFATTPNGVFAAKVHRSQLRAAERWLTHGPRWRRTATNPFLRVAPEVCFCWVSRRDKVRQAVSLLRAQATREYRRQGGAAPAPPGPALDHAAIRRTVELLEEWETGWERFFDDIDVTPARVWYEDDLEWNYAPTTALLLGVLGIETPAEVVVTTDYQRIADSWSDDTVARYLDDERSKDA
jgi:LPS sulfotransferase NodH